MSKIIIHNKSTFPDSEALGAVWILYGKRRVDGLTVWEDKYMDIIERPNKASVTFTVRNKNIIKEEKQ